MQLDEYQQAAATAPENRVLVTACPGSGKSRTLVARFEHLVEDRHISPALIACITFTRYGAGVIKDRLGPRIAGRAFLGTFHSFALQIIKGYGTKIGYEGSWVSILDQEEVALEEVSILKDMGLINAKGAWTRCKSHDWAEYRDRKVNGAETPPWPLPFEKDFDLVWKTLMDRFRAENVLTFGTMILEAISLLEIESVREQVRKRVQHVLVDECLRGDAMIAMADGTTRTIRELVENRVDENVLSYDPKSRMVVERRITGWHKVSRNNRRFYQVGDAVMTEDHPVLTQNEWKKACIINMNQVCILEPGAAIRWERVPVQELCDQEGMADETVYCIDVEETHNFFANNICVHNCQDNDSRQWRILELLDPETLFVVGDVDQAIYGWRGSRPELFIEFASEVARYDLPNSYRFGFKIAEPANALIRHNQARLDTAITAIAENKGAVQVAKDVQPEQIADIIREELKTYAPSQIAVLARRHSTLDELARELKAHKDIPFVQIGGAEEVPKTGAFRTVRGYLRLSVNPKDARAFMAIATAERISTPALIELRAKANSEKVSLAEAYGQELPENLGAIQVRLHDTDPHTDYQPAIQYMQELMLFEGIVDAQELLEVLSMETHQDRLRTAEDAVVLCSCHASKGLEWPVVLVIGMNADQFPSRRSMREGREEEERRIAYVAFTRAEEKLYLIHAPPKTADDGASQFLSEIGDVEQRVVDRFGGDDLVY